MFSLQETLAEGGRGSSSIFIYIHCKHSDFDVRILKFRNWIAKHFWCVGTYFHDSIATEIKYCTRLLENH